jgi:hypothetical protein
MSLYIDIKYINYIGNQLSLFKRKGDYLFNFRCPVCGDSSKKKNRARGYFYRIKNEMHMKCHNCGLSSHFGTFLKKLNPSLYGQYSFERYSNNTSKTPHKKINLTFETPVFQQEEKSIIDELMDRLDKLPKDHIAIKFCEGRKIPIEAYKRLYFIESMQDVHQLSSNYKDKIVTKEPRIAIPFYDDNKQLVALTCRALGDEKIRYVNVVIKEDVPLIFGADRVDSSQHIYVTEGPIDSLFLPNAIAVGGTGFKKLKYFNLNKDKITLIIDNQPRNKEVCKILNSLIENDYSVVIWPLNQEEKDINDLILSGMTKEEVLSLVNERTFKGLNAKINFMTWKKI